MDPVPNDLDPIEIDLAVVTSVEAAKEQAETEAELSEREAITA